jgi:hypothetical protein
VALSSSSASGKELSTNHRGNQKGYNSSGRTSGGLDLIPLQGASDRWNVTLKMIVLTAKAMRICPTFVILAAVVAASGCGETKISPTAATQGGASHGSPPAARVAGTSRVIGRLAPSGLVVRPDIADPQCNGGYGVRLRGPFGGRKQVMGHEESVTVTSGTTAGDSTLIAFTSYSPGKNFAVLNAITRRCARDRGFGTDGTATITIPSSLKPPTQPADDGLSEGLSIDVVAAGNGGGAIVAGSYAGGWVVGEVTASGQLNPRFARGGWSVLPFEGTVTNVLQETSGRILIGGNEHASGCCTVNWAAALSADG